MVKSNDQQYLVGKTNLGLTVYSKPQPSVMPDVEATLRTIGRWKYLIKTDLKQAYFQIPLSKESRRFAGTASPFKGVRVFKRAAMGLPGSETALEELMNRVEKMENKLQT